MPSKKKPNNLKSGERCFVCKYGVMFMDSVKNTHKEIVEIWKCNACDGTSIRRRSK